jgi:hypothetical protein
LLIDIGGECRDATFDRLETADQRNSDSGLEIDNISSFWESSRRVRMNIRHGNISQI